MSTIIDIAKQKFGKSNKVDFSMNLNEFIADCYVKLPPCSYGGRIQQKITKDLGIKNIVPSLNQGDAVVGKKLIEIKTSYLSRTGTYALTHLRMWQKFSYYLFCLIDCEDGFTPKFYLVDKYVVNRLKLSPMNGTKESNSENSNIEMRTTVKKNSSQYRDIERYNKLKGTDFNDLKDFIRSMAV